MWICDGPGKDHHFQICPNMVWEEIVLGTISEKLKPREKPYQEYVDL